jgi:hypothetical protein
MNIRYKSKAFVRQHQSFLLIARMELASLKDRNKRAPGSR